MVNTYWSLHGSYAWSYPDVVALLEDNMTPQWLLKLVDDGTVLAWKIEADWHLRVQDYTGQSRDFQSPQYLVLLSGQFHGQVAIYAEQDVLESFKAIGAVIDVPTSASINIQRAAAGMVEHPDHYGGKDNPYEVIKVIDAWGLDFHLGNSVKYIARAGKKDPEKEIQDLEKARFYIDHKINLLKEKRNV